MFLIIDGDDLYSDRDSFATTIEDIKAIMPKMDKELTLFSIGPKNILNLVDSYCAANEQVREKRIKYYAYSTDQVVAYGMSRFNYYIKLTVDGIVSTKIEEGFSIV
jgi:hypothetical protein